MKKFFFLSAAFAISMMASAQKIVSFGFEDADKGGNYHCQYALTPRPDGLGDWVNVHEGDNWIEQSAEAAHSGTYGLEILNSEEGSANSWDRGFKLANLPIKEGVPYRVSFWVKTFTPEAKLSSWLSVGMENFDKSFTTAAGNNYGLDQITLNDDGEWQRVSYVSVYHGKEAIKTVIDGQSWVGNATFPEEFGGQGETYKEHFDGYIPETFFFIANLNSAGDYMLDDILIEENVALKGVTYNDMAVKIDFGFPTNVAALANENGGSLILPNECVTVKQGNQTLTPLTVEGKADGFVYIFFEEGQGPNVDSTDPVVVSFTPDAECPIKYNAAQRPVAEENATVLGFENEVGYVDESIDALSSAWAAPSFVSVVPENNSFNLTADDFKEVVLTFNMPIGIDYTSAKLSYSDNFGAKETDLTKNMKVDGNNLIITMPAGLQDNQYKLTVYDVENELGVPMENNIVLTYELGEDTEAAEVETMYKSDFNGDETDAVPQGWNTYNEAGYHLYGFNDDGSRMKYGYGANPGGGGTRLFDGFSGDFTKALYWGTRGTNEGYASFGELIADYMDADGNVDESALPDGVNKEDISLYLEPGKYNVSFKMAAWKGAPQFNFTLEDLDGEVYANFEGYTAKPDLNGAKGKVTGTLALEADFSIEKEGYYVLKFVAAEAQWQEFMLADVQVITMPSKAAYYNGLLHAVAAEVEDVYYNSLDVDDALGSSPAQKALRDEIDFAQKNVFKSPSQVDAEIAKLKELADALQARVDNIQKFNDNIETAATGIEELKGTKYENVDVVAEVAEIVKNYGQSDPTKMTDEELAKVAPVLASATAKLANVEKCTDVLTAGINKAIETYTILGVQADAELAAAEAAISDDRDVAYAINKVNKLELYKQIAAGTWNAEDKLTIANVFETKMMPITTEDGEIEDWQNVAADSVAGIEMTGFVANPYLYRVNGNSGLPGWTIVGGAEGKNANVAYNDNNPNESEYVKDQYISSYGDVNFDISQAISNLPVGKYAVTIKARTPLVDKIADYGRMFYYNAQNDSTNVWDMFIYATVGNDSIITPFNGADSGMGNANAALREITIKDGDVLTVGLHENYVSGVATKHESNEATSVWEGTVMADDVRLFFIAPLEGYDYAAAAKELETALDTVVPNATIVDIYNTNGVRLSKAQKGVNIVKMSNGKIVKVLVK